MKYKSNLFLFFFRQVTFVYRLLYYIVVNMSYLEWASTTILTLLTAYFYRAWKADAKQKKDMEKKQVEEIKSEIARNKQGNYDSDSEEEQTKKNQ